MGADRQLADWDQLLDYYRHVAENSPRIRLEELGPTTLGKRHSQREPDHVSGLDLSGNTFVVLYISSPDNLENLEQIRQWNQTLSDPRGASESDIEQAIDQGKAIVAQSYGLHSNEVAATQTAAEFVYEQVTREDEEMQRIRDNTISVVFPSFNPDGTTMIADWYRETKGTEHEGVSMPWLYHHYVGHDNNRDGYMLNTTESRYIAEILYREWKPQAYVDHHEMGNDGPRFYVPPYSEPIRPKGDPLVWREMDWYGAHMSYEAQQEGISGVTDGTIFGGWGHFGWHWITPFHNIAGMLTESAHTGRYATPTYFQPDQLEGNPNRGFPYYGEQVSFPDPWEGGWWSVRDIVEQQKVASFATLDIAARDREKVLRSAYLKAERQIERGENEDPAAYVIPADQHDPLTMTKMVNRLIWQGIDVERAEEQFVHEGRVYGEDSYVVSLAQPKRGVIRWLLGRTFYPDNDFTRDDDGNPIWPYDLSTHTMFEFMGVDVHPADTPVDESLAPVQAALDPTGTVEEGTNGSVMDGRLNDSFHAMNRLLEEDVEVRRIQQPAEGSDLRPGDFLVSADAPEPVLRNVAETTGVDFSPIDENPGDVSAALKPLDIGVYRPYYRGNMDEGWTRMLLENFGFAYESLRDSDITSGALSDQYDVLVFPEEDLETMLGPDLEDWELKPPEQYRSGFGEEGVDALDRFVRSGGTLLTFGESGDLAIEELGVPVEDKVDGLSSPGGGSGYSSESGQVEFWAPGSTLRMNVDNTHPLAYGMPSEAYALFWRNNQVYKTQFHHRSQDMYRYATYQERNILQSGWLEGEEHISEEAAAVSVGHGDGTVVMLGFRPQFRHTTHGTFKLVFNALVSGATNATRSP